MPRLMFFEILNQTATITKCLRVSQTDIHPQEMWQQKLQQEKKHRQDVNVVLLQEKLRGEEQQEKLLAKEKQRENDADLFLFFYI